MTRKDYELLATAIAQAYSECKTDECRKGVEAVMEHVAHALQFDNPRFNTQRFVSAVKRAIR